MIVFYYRHWVLPKTWKLTVFSESQAKAITETVREAQQQNLDVLITKCDLENGFENLEVCLSGFPFPDRVEDKLRWNDMLKKFFSLYCHSGRSEAQTRNPGVLFTKLDFKQYLILNLDKIWKFKKLRSPLPKRPDPAVTWFIGRHFWEVKLRINKFPEIPAVQADLNSGCNYWIKAGIALYQLIKMMCKQ